MNIYIPYTYLIGWSKHNIWYYGRRTAKNCHPNDLWKTYFTSSKEVNTFFKENGNPDIIQIRKTFPNNPDACKLWESKVLEKLDVQHDSRFLNKKNGDHKWDSTRMVSVKDINGNTFQVSVNDQRYISGELLHVLIGKPNTQGYTNKFRKENGYKTIPGKPKGSKENIETKTKKSETRKGKITVKDNNGVCFLVDKNDERIKTGELVWVSKNFGRKGPHLEETKQKLRVPKSEEHKEKLKVPKSEEHKQKLKISATNRPVFYCETCCTNIKGISNWNKHIKSIKHHSKLK